MEYGTSGNPGKKDLERILGFVNVPPEERDYSIIGTFAPRDAEGICVYCNHCRPCPAGLDVALISKYYDMVLAGDELAGNHYEKLEKRQETVSAAATAMGGVPFMWTRCRV